nr:RNA polymerase III largest subunit [Cryptomonas curvata]
MKNSLSNEIVNTISLEFSFSSIIEGISSSNLNISNQFLYSNSNTKPCIGGILDNKLGWLGRNPCRICKKDFKSCPGHFGFIKLYLPVFNIGYIKTIQTILQIVCKGCSKILIEPGEKRTKVENHLKHIKKYGEFNKIKFIASVLENSKKYTNCPYCDSKNGIIRKIGNFNFIHDTTFSSQFKNKKNFEENYINTENSITSNISILNPLKIFRILQKIKIEDLEILDMNQINTRPENLMLTYIPVPPLAIRPSILIGEKTSNEDDLTIKLAEIQQLNLQIKKNIFNGVEIENLMESWNMLQIESARYLNSEIFPKENDLKTSKGLYQRLKGKNGRFRGNLSGKRVDFSARTVISPDPSLPLNMVGIPFQIASKLTFPEKINKINFERLRRNVNRGSSMHPGANFIVDLFGKKITIQGKNNLFKQPELREGFRIERHLKNNDIVLFNRQPSLHRVSIMAHRVKIVRGKTFKFNSCNCKPYNADFDGDEMNIHVPQTQKARAEAITLMNQTLNIITPRNGELQVAPTQDLLSSSFMITSKDQFFSIDSFSKFFNLSDQPEMKKILPIPAIIKPLELWTGKQIFSSIIFNKHKNSFSQNFTDTIQTIEKIYSLNEKQCSPFVCPYEGWILFQKGQLLAGRIGKNTIGSGDKSSIYSMLATSHSFKFTIECMLKNSLIGSKWISEFGFSIGIDDVSSKSSFFCEKKRLISHGYNLCQSIHSVFQKQKNEHKIQKILSFIRDDLGKYCMKIKSLKNNSSLVMVASGSKGSIVNLAQMISCLGQQSVNGARISCGIFGRTLPSLKFNNSKIIPIYNGFIENSLNQGLTNGDFFFHAIAGREGLIDTAVKTAETGYLQRRLMKSLEDIVSFYDSSVRTSDGRLIQFKFGDDNLDPIRSSWLCEGTNIITNISKKPILFGHNSINLFEVDSFSRASFFYDVESFPYFSALINLFYSCYLTNHFKYSICFLETELIFRKVSRISILCLNDAGSSVGAGAGQSLGEPGTQMTLQTFHSAGVSSMNITLGVPRINEVMNASKIINSPMVKINFITLGNKQQILKIKNNLEKTFLGEICRSIEIVIKSNQLKCKICLDLNLISRLEKTIDLKNIKKIIIATLKMWDKQNFILKNKKYTLEIFFCNIVLNKNFACLSIMKLINFCKNDLINLPVTGLAEHNLIINQNDELKSQFFIKNCNLIEIMNYPSIDRKTVYCNHIITIFEVFGIEAARNVIIIEIEATFQSHGITIDTRHLALLSDLMTFQGEILGITRHGLLKMKSNTLVLASFEKTIENLFFSATRRSRDEVLGVSESIILGKESPIGTGLVSLKHIH